MDGRMELRTGDGSIRVSDVKGELILNSGDGSISVDHADGRLVLDTGDGGVNVEGNFSAVKMHTGDGSIVYRADSDTRMEADWDITTGDGSVSLYLPAGFSANLDAHTGDGRIRTDLDVQNDRDLERDGDASDRERRTLRGRIGQGGKRLRIQTGDGGITLKTR
jgi:Putative adhesin